ncbi:kinase-like domain-containing protein [Plectosphaerella cucumerina]|uniref:Kinase-like domain-containing protein n=1 Tax=Plectosphaerella cucumerina TaxID=40658 RepID=A0A8K0X7R5_9PEZI|nr:kinase-like domain-containing protein [Plectosphaerella cucumerina]
MTIPATSRITLESPDTVRRWGDSARLRREVEAMTYVQQNTSIPVPAILEVCLDDESDEDKCWILMERLPGHQLGTAWPEMGEEAQSETIRQLRSFLSQMHQLRPSGPATIGSVSGGPAYDHRLSNMRTCSPFASVAEFNDFLVSPVRQCPRPEWVAKYRNQLPDTHGVRFSHADLSWENILVDTPMGKVTGILDWEMAGFWPDWWEYRKALFGSRSRPWWVEVLKQVMTEYPKETEVAMELEMF